MGTISTVTIGTDDFSVYALTADPNTDADSFWNVRLGPQRTAWEAAAEDDQNRALVMASDWIDRAVSFSGTVTAEDQDRAWPRDGADCNGTSVTDGTTPDALAYAAFWLAGAILVDTEAAFGTGEGSNVKKAKAGSAEVTFFTPTIGTGADTRLPTPAHDYLKCFVGSSGISAGASYGTTRDLPTECDFDRNGGYS